ncbi:MAG: CoA transferase [Betaproteobacteria bacterium]|jgi:formyl-CoA transferase|nr:CoA transferase [Betaproteobacteria bacterium]
MSHSTVNAASLAASSRLPLAGLRVLELGQLIAGPFCARVLADFGAEVLKVEAPEGGDPLRNWRVLKDGNSIWWESQSRNKRSIAIDLKQAEGQALVRTLVRDCDVIIENFRPGQLEQWGLSYERLSEDHPGLIMLRISGYGQTGPYKDRPGFGVIGEAMGGLRYLSGEPGEIPVRVGVSIGDSLAALHGVIGIMMALREREVRGGKGQVIDVALYESVFNMMESLIPEYSVTGLVREPSGSALPGIAPTNAYRCNNGLVLIAGNGDGIFRRLMTAIGREDLAHDQALQDNAGRVAQVSRLDEAIAAWTAQRSVESVLTCLHEASVPAGKIYNAADIASDPHYLAREMLVGAKSRESYDLTQPGIVPKLSETPGKLRSAAPRLGEHTRQALAEAGLREALIAQLLASGTVRQS